MERGFPHADDMDAQINADADSLGRCFPDIPFLDISQPLVRRMAHSVVALHVAAHNCDFYITKYSAKPLEQLQNLITQYAVGLRRLEVEEEQARSHADARGENLQPDLQRRARRVLLKLQGAANRCHWFSSTELATFLKTGDTCWTTHSVRPLFLSRHMFLLHECQRLLENRTPGILEAAPVTVNTVEFALAPPPRGTSTAVARADAPPEVRPEASVMNATDDDALCASARAEEDDDAGSADALSNDARGSRDASPNDEDAEQECDDLNTDDDDEHAAEGFVPTAIHATTSAVDDWLHRGPFLEPLPLFVYMQHVQRVPQSQRLLT